MTSIGEEGRRPYVRFYGMLKIPVEYARDTLPAKVTDISSPIFASLLGIFAGICQRPLVDESGIVKTQIGTRTASEYGRSA
jgi:hypothetical protein